MTRKILTLVTLAGLLTVGGCAASSAGLNARYEDYEDYDDGYADYCPPASHYGSYQGGGPYPFTFPDSGYSYRPGYAEETGGEKEQVEPLKYKESNRAKEKSVRASGRQNVSLKERSPK